MSSEQTGELAQAVHAFFDRTEKALPYYVPAMPSMVVAIIATLIVFTQGLASVLEDKSENVKSKDPLKKFRWIIMLAVLLAVCAMLYDFVQEKVYNISMIALNKQHIANLHWIRQYKKSMRGPVGSVIG